jgi:hypothetical protein
VLIFSLVDNTKKIIDNLLAVTNEVGNVNATGSTAATGTTMDKSMKLGKTTSFVKTLVGGTSTNPINFRLLPNAPTLPGVDVVLSKDSVRKIQQRLQFTLYGYFLGDRVGFFC